MCRKGEINLQWEKGRKEKEYRREKRIEEKEAKEEKKTKNPKKKNKSKRRKEIKRKVPIIYSTIYINELSNELSYMKQKNYFNIYEQAFLIKILCFARELIYYKLIKMSLFREKEKSSRERRKSA